MPHPRKTQVLYSEIHQLPFPETTAITLIAVQYTGEGCFTNMILHRYSFKSFVVLSAEYFNAPLSTVNWYKIFYGFFYLSTITSQFSVI